MRIPGPKWGAGRPPLETPKSSLALSGLAELLAALRLELRCRWGRPRARARSPRPPHLHRFGVGAGAPLPPKVPKRGRLPVTRLFWGLRPLAPCVPRWKRLPIMRASAWYRARNGFCGNAFANLPEAPAAKRLGVPSLPSRELRPKAAPARPQRGIPKGERLWPALLPTFLQEQKSRGPRAARARRRTKKNF